jgi:Glycosyl transferase family 2
MSGPAPAGGPIQVPPPVGRIEPLSQPPTFSVVITAYEAADTIAAAVGSALDQEHPAHEVIVVDDGSKDELAEALEPFADRIRIVRKENGGGASARNAGVAASSGEFMAILDADDRFHRRRLRALAELAMARPDLDMITTDSCFVVDGEPVGRFAAENPFAVDDQQAAIFRSCFLGGWPAVRLAPLRALGGFDEEMRIAYDWDCWLRLLLAGSSAGLADEPLYDYVLRSGSLASSRVASRWERVKLLEKAAATHSLSARHRGLRETAIRRRRDEAVREEIEAMLAGDSDRGRLRELIGLGGVGGRQRGLAALALVAPPLARRLVSTRPAAEKRFA